MASIIKLSDVWWKYEKDKDWVLKGINVDIKKGEFVLIVGPNLAGKTTLAMCFNGLVPHSYPAGEFKGNVIISNNIDTRNYTVAEISKKVGLVFQDVETQFVTMSVEDELVFGPEIRGLSREEIGRRLKWVLKIMRLEGLSDKAPFDISGGQKQRAAIGAALMNMPEILVLDEPTTELDPLGKAEVLESIKQLNKELGITVILIEHLTEETAPMADRVLFLYDGKIIDEGKPDDIFQRVDHLKSKGVKPPQVTELFYLLKKAGVPLKKLPITFDEAESKLFELLRPTSATFKTPKIKTTELRVFNQKSEPIADLSDVTFVYPDGTLALQEVSLKIFRDDPMIGIIGQNGSGKTTLAKLLAGILKPTKGRVFLGDLDTTKAHMAEIGRKVGYVFQNPDHQISSNTVREEVSLGPRNLGLAGLELERRVIETMKDLEIEEFAGENPFLLPKGVRQRIAIASVLAMKPRIIIVDEPTTGQDFKSSYTIMDKLTQLHKRGHKIIVITHNMSLVAEYCGRSIVIDKGRIVLDGPTGFVFMQEDVLKRTSLKPPQATSLSNILSSIGIPAGVTSVEKLSEILINRIGLSPRSYLRSKK
jgi:energy-coupling factor transport system ATP-binding protein